MKSLFTSRLFKLLWLQWILMVALFIVVWLYPVSTGLTRAVGVVLFVFVWLGLIALGWRLRWLRFALLGVTAFCLGVLVLPGKGSRDLASLREGYACGMRRYESVTYYWGGESPMGIDCSGLIRRGLIDSLFLRGVRTLDGGMIRHSLWLWWHDCSAKHLGEGHEFTTPLFTTPALNELDHAKILPGDLAVATNGSHVMAYLGDKKWIEADPGAEKVLIETVPTKNAWFRGSMNIVRWKFFEP